jgi:hypothetical protein
MWEVISAVTSIHLSLPRWRASTFVCLLVLAASLLLVVVTSLLTPMKDDIAWLLYVAEQWLRGRHLYVDLVEVNPPLIIWLYAVPVAVADALGGQAGGGQAGLVALPMFLMLVLGFSWWAACLARRPGAPFDDRVAVFAVIASVLLLIPGEEFGQREHLLVVLALPYLALVAAELGGARPARAHAVLAGLLAALGCALKPRYLIAFGLVEAVAFLQGLRPIRPATLAASALLAVYGAAIVVLEPAFLRDAVPMALALYGGTDAALGDLVFDCRVMLFAVAVGLVLLTTKPAPNEDRRQVAVLLAFAAGAALVCIIQGKNWFYHRIPAIVTALLALFAWAAPRLRQPWRLQWRRSAPVLLATLAVGAAGLSAYERLRPRLEIAIERQATVQQKLIDLVRREHATSYLAMSEMLALGFPVVNNTGVAWGSRFDSMWALKGELWRAREDGRAPVQWPVGRWVAQDFLAACPDIVVVDRREPGLDYVAILSHADRDFVRIWSAYERIASFDGLQVFRRNKHHPVAGCGALHGALKLAG